MPIKRGRCPCHLIKSRQNHTTAQPATLSSPPFGVKGQGGERKRQTEKKTKGFIRSCLGSQTEGKQKDLIRDFCGTVNVPPHH